MTSGSCPRCRSVLEEDASFCHSCGLDLTAASSLSSLPSTPPVPVPSPAPFQPGFAPYPMYAAPSMEMPVNPMGHERALTSIASVMMFFNASLVIIFAIMYLVIRVYVREEVWVDGDWRREQVIQWEWLLASVFMLCSFGAGITGGIAAVRAVRFNVAMVSSLLLLVSSLIILWDSEAMMFESFTLYMFMLITSVVPVVLLVMARSVFTEPPPQPGKGPPPTSIDNYGWSTMPGSDVSGHGTGPGGVGP